MKSTPLRRIVALFALLLALACSAPAKDPAGGKSNVKEGAYYEFRGHMSDRDTIAFVVLIIVLLFRPGGILGSSKVEKV